MGRSCKPHWLRNSAWHREKHKQFCQGAEEIAQTSPRICAQHRPATNTITWKWQYILAERPRRYATQSERETDGKDQIVDLNDSGVNSLLDSLFHLCSGEDVKASAPWTLFHICNMLLYSWGAGLVNCHPLDPICIWASYPQTFCLHLQWHLGISDSP